MYTKEYIRWIAQYLIKNESNWYVINKSLKETGESWTIKRDKLFTVYNDWYWKIVDSWAFKHVSYFSKNRVWLLWKRQKAFFDILWIRWPKRKDRELSYDFCYLESRAELSNKETEGKTNPKKKTTNIESRDDSYEIFCQAMKLIMEWKDKLLLKDHLNIIQHIEKNTSNNQLEIMCDFMSKQSGKEKLEYFRSLLS